MFYKINKKSPLNTVTIITIIFIVSIIVISISLSYEYNISNNVSSINYSTLSQFISGFGALGAIIIALYLPKIQIYLKLSTITLIEDEYKGKYDISEYSNDHTYYKINFKVSNLIKNTLIENCNLYLLPIYDGFKVISLPTPIEFLMPNTLSSSFRDYKFFNLGFFRIKFSSELEFKFALQLYDGTSPYINCFETDQLSFVLETTSQTFTKDLKYQVIIKYNKVKVEEFLNVCKKYRVDYISSNNDRSNGFEDIDHGSLFQRFYDLITMEIKPY